MTEFSFLISSERSGSNLIRVMLDSHRSVCAPSSPHFIRLLLPLQEYYRARDSREGNALLQKHFAELLALRPHGWKTTREAILALPVAEDGGFPQIFTAIYRHEASLQGKSHLFIKDNGVINHVGELLRLFPDARFVYLVRDCRDFVLSWLRSANHVRNLRVAASQWQREQEQALAALASPLGKARILLVRYEELIGDPEASGRRICAHLGLEFDPGVLRFNEGRQARQHAGVYANWKNLDKPILNNNRDKFLTGMNEVQIRQIEAIAYDTLQSLGYKIFHASGRSDPGLPEQRNYLPMAWNVIRMLVDRNVSWSEVRDRVRRARKIYQIRREARGRGSSH
jgi:hypothetical protein